MASEDDEGMFTNQQMLIGGAVVVGGLYLMSKSKSDNRQIDLAPENICTEFADNRCWNANDCVENVHVSERGVCSVEAETIIDKFKQAVEANGNEVCWRREVDGTFEACTWVQHYRNCTKMAKSLMKVGVGQHDTINILGFNSWEWVTANLGVILAGGISAGQYTTNNAGQCEYIAEHSQAKVAVIEGKKQLDKWNQIHNNLGNLECIVVWGMSADELDAEKKNFDAQLFTFDEFLEFGNDVSDDELGNRQALIRPGHCASLIYTSGTTGNPKAVMMSHDNLTWTIKSVMASTGVPFDINHRLVSYLPLSHVAAQLLDIYMPIMGTSLASGAHVEVWFALPSALKGTLVNSLQACRPTFFFGVPRVWEKLKEGILKKSRANPKGAVMDAFVQWAKGRCKAANDTKCKTNGPYSAPFGYSVAKALMNKVKGALGLDKAVYFLTGAAPISSETLDYFKNLDIYVNEVYGMSESAGPATMGRLYHSQMGSTGPALDGTEVELKYDPSRDKAGEGEICFRGRHIMMGYLNNETKTRETIDDEGWLHSGDVGRFDKNGCLFITGRIKELLITEGGENIAPVPIETYIKDNAECLSNVIMIGDRRKFCSLLVSWKTKVNLDNGQPTSELDCTVPGSSATTVTEAMQDEVCLQYVENVIMKYNADQQACASRAQKLQKFRILPEDLSVPGGTLGPTLKVKRPVIYRLYPELIETMYDETAARCKTMVEDFTTNGGLSVL